MVQTGRLFKIVGMFLLFTFVLFSCKEENKSIPPAKLIVPIFNADSAYAHIEKQLSFGPRVPGTPAQVECKEWMVSKLKSYGAKVSVQEYTGKIFDGSVLPGYNIMAQFNPKAKTRVLLAAHWDSRKVADKDNTRKDEAIMGADDGASGTAALIEIARLIQSESLNLGVDILLFDLEDQGDLDGSSKSNYWTIGSLYWSKNLMPRNYKAKFGILLDMIAAKGARFGREGFSTRDARIYQDKIWELAKRTGKGDLFLDYNAGAISDDHVHVNNIGIPMVDIINRPMRTASGFGAYHHTHNDDISIISKKNLGSVGQLITTIIYREAVGRF